MPQMTSDAASNGPQPFFPHPLPEDQLLRQHFFGILQESCVFQCGRVGVCLLHPHHLASYRHFA
jgi:hypothetical protein